MPAKTVYSDDIVVGDFVEIAGAFLTVTDVLIQDELHGRVFVTAIPTGSPDLVFKLEMPKYWPTNIYRKM